VASSHAFPKHFLWGTATSSYQVEGAVHADGRGSSVWDTFSHTRGNTFQGQSGDIAVDHFHRYKEDVALMKELGAKAYRFSVAWPRIFPTGVGAPNSRGLDFYRNLLDELQSAGIVPFCTLFHWDLPQALEDKGGWTNPDTGKAFAEYAAYVTGALSDRVSHWITMNEFNSFIDAGYGSGGMAPGRRLSRKELAQTRHYALCAHGMAVQAVRAAAKVPVKVGLAEDTQGFMPAVSEPANIAAAKAAIREENARFTTALLEGKYTDHYLKSLGADAPQFTPEDLKTLSTPLDFFGVNIYTSTEVMSADTPLGYKLVKRPPSYPRMASPWLAFNPQSLYWTPKLIHSVWGVKDIFITENGCSCEEPDNCNDTIADSDRILFLRNYIEQLQKGISEGVPVRGYFLWSLLDNFEWGSGFSKRFGIVHVDLKTLQRTPKLSFEFYRRLIAESENSGYVI
jgi:beta-glucosidase